MNKIGLVLSGGGARGFAHLGLLKAMDELAVKPYAISGVSVGAVLGALYAEGKSTDEILALTKGNSYFGFSNLLWRKAGFFSMEAIRQLLLENIPHNSFEGLKLPLFVNATDFTHNKAIFFSAGELVPCLVASASVPVLFNSVEMDSHTLVDGALLNNLPVEPLMTICDKIIGSHVNKLEEISSVSMRLSKLAVLERCFHMSIANSVYSRGQHCDLFMEPELFNFGMFDTKNADTIFEIGYRHAMKEKEKILALQESD
ncbi:MAG: patatin-like phospholipase family protein [Ginsengibacter sp.]